MKDRGRRSCDLYYEGRKLLFAREEKKKKKKISSQYSGDEKTAVGVNIALRGGEERF